MYITKLNICINIAFFNLYNERMIQMQPQNNECNTYEIASNLRPSADETLMKFMGSRKYKGTFIDFGCSDGYFTFVAENFFTYVIGVDVNIITINELLKTKPDYSQAKFIRSHNYSTALPDSSADVIFMFNLLHKIENMKQFIREIKRLLKEDGELWILEPKQTINEICKSSAPDITITKNELMTRLKDDELHFIEYINIDKNFYGVKFTKNEDLFMRFYRQT